MDMLRRYSMCYWSFYLASFQVSPRGMATLTSRRQTLGLKAFLTSSCEYLLWRGSATDPQRAYSDLSSERVSLSSYRRLQAHDQTTTFSSTKVA